MTIPVCEPVLDGNEEKYVLDALRSNWISSSGKYINELEEKFSAYCGVSHGVSCSSGTASLHLACLALGIEPGDEVIIPSFTLIVSANVIILCGAKPVLVDVDPETWCLDPSQIESKITKKTKAVMAVHVYGHPCEMDALMVIAKKYNLKVIEDCAEAHGAEVHGKKVGSIGDVGCFSFYGNKLLTMGEGGLLITNDAAVAKRAKLLRNQAFEEPRFVHQATGFNYRLTNLQAAIGVAQLEKIEEKIERKREIATQYAEWLKEADVTLPIEREGYRNVYWMYGILLGESFDSKESVMTSLKEKGVGTRSFFCGMHEQPVFRKPNRIFPDITGNFPVSDKLFRRGLYLPSGLSLSAEEIKSVTSQLRSCRRRSLAT